mmetsp:Transcript_6335/g.22448  ORF Transcript_6335/g.22448 Transcript_6335/m.22448 type:complete len:330 (+) Transcript_6335:411-1400(+)
MCVSVQPKAVAGEAVVGAVVVVLAAPRPPAAALAPAVARDVPRHAVVAVAVVHVAEEVVPAARAAARPAVGATRAAHEAGGVAALQVVCGALRLGLKVAAVAVWERPEAEPAELGAAAARHVVAPRVLFDGLLALRALLRLLLEPLEHVRRRRAGLVWVRGVAALCAVGSAADAGAGDDAVAEVGFAYGADGAADAPQNRRRRAEGRAQRRLALALVHGHKVERGDVASDVARGEERSALGHRARDGRGPRALVRCELDAELPEAGPADGVEVCGTGAGDDVSDVEVVHAERARHRAAARILGRRQDAVHGLVEGHLRPQRGKALERVR